MMLMNSSFSMHASMLAVSLALSTMAQAATPRADIARPTDFAPVPVSGAKACRSGKLMTCGRQVAGGLAAPAGSAPRSAYRFAEEEFLFDSGVGIFLQTAVAARKGADAPVEWRRRLAFKRAADGGFQLVQIGIQYRCAGGDWQKGVCKTGRPAAEAARMAKGGNAAGKQASGAAGTTVAGVTGATGQGADAPGRGAAASGTGGLPAEQAAAVAEVAGKTAGHVDPEAARILAEQEATEPQPRLDARWRPIQPGDQAAAADREAEARSAARAAAAARQPAPRTQSGAEIVAAQPSVSSDQLNALRADEALANRSAGIEPEVPGVAQGKAGTGQTGRTTAADTAGAPGQAPQGGAGGRTHAGDAALAKAMQRADAAHAAGAGALGQGAAAAKGVSGAGAAGAVAGQAGAAGAQAARGKIAPGASDPAAEVRAGDAQEAGAAGEASAAPGTAGMPDAGAAGAAAHAEEAPRPTPAGPMTLQPTPPSSVRAADGFSPIVLAPENMNRMGALCEQPIDLCGQRVFDELFSSESHAQLSPRQIQRERFIYADGPVVSAVYLVTLANLPDDALLGERVRIEFVRRGSGWVAVAAGRQLRCRSGKVGIHDWTGMHCGEDPDKP
ncbi:MAG: hypothetical protein Q4E06_13225 [Lautropia sp.]|nr:hypothetical protein [Lautropia sp.]